MDVDGGFVIGFVIGLPIGIALAWALRRRLTGPIVKRHDPRPALTITQGNPNRSWCMTCDRPVKREQPGQPWVHVA
jgi:hypothetical protein